MLKICFKLLPIARSFPLRCLELTEVLSASIINMPAKRKATKQGSEKEEEVVQKKQRSRKADSASDGDEKATPEKAATKKKAKSSVPESSTVAVASEATTSSGQKWNMKFASWNVNGVRAWVEKNGHSYITAEDPDIFCIQETKCTDNNLPSELKNVTGYKTYWLAGDKDGYSGTALFTKKEPINVSYGINNKKHDNEGRVITAEFDKFFFVTAYVPNSGRGLPRLEYRTTEWDVDFREYLKKLDETKPVILCGDLNVSHLEIDLANPKTNTKTAGFTKEEREQFSELLKAGFIDSYRHLHPDTTGVYSYWTYMYGARLRNIGWRLDYFVLSERLKDALCESLIRTDVLGSDHCPVVLLMHF